MKRKDDIIKRQPGRPIGHKLSDVTKERIREKRLGTRHSKETKDKISRSLTAYFRRRDSLGDSIEQEYECVSDEVMDWIIDHKSDLDNMDNVLTERRLVHLKQLELCIGSDIESFGHNTTPEFILLLKEKLESLGLNRNRLDEMYSLI